MAPVSGSIGNPNSFIRRSVSSKSRRAFALKIFFVGHFMAYPLSPLSDLSFEHSIGVGREAVMEHFAIRLHAARRTFHFRDAKIIFSLDVGPVHGSHLIAPGKLFVLQFDGDVYVLVPVPVHDVHYQRSVLQSRRGIDVWNLPPSLARIGWTIHKQFKCRPMTV